MRFKVGDQVVHTSHGSGQIVAIEEKRLSNNETRLFYAVVINQSTVWVPVESDSDSSLRLLVSNSALAHCRELLKGRPAPLNADRRQRALELNQRLRRSSFEMQCEVVRDLSAHGWPKPLSAGDVSALRKIRADVCLEWAAAAGVPPLDATLEITALLQEGRQTFNI
jgi:RNA polymerase-interacting CarD/CdnL/TRCF family regulator